MTSRTATTFLIFTGLGLAAGQAIGESSPTARGKHIAQRFCARCHAIGEAGASPMGLAPPFRDLSKRYPIENLQEALAEGIVVGHPAMPPFTFEPREIDALLTYISGLKAREGADRKQ
jgi:cytochrome c